MSSGKTKNTKFTCAVSRRVISYKKVMRFSFMYSFHEKLYEPKIPYIKPLFHKHKMMHTMRNLYVRQIRTIRIARLHLLVKAVEVL